VRIWTAGPVSIGEDTFIGHEVLITGGAASIHIGNHCDIAPRVTIAGGSHEEGTGNRAAGKGISKAIAIQDGVWLGAGVTVLGGVSIGAGAIIGAGSLVSKDVTEDTVAAGVPCAFIRQRTQNEECRS
jgi:maltose O-acetyltransferase